MGKPKDPRFRDKDTENFYHGERVLKFQEIKDYLENKTNPALKNWYDAFKPEPDPVKRLDLINRQISKHLISNLLLENYIKLVKKRDGWIKRLTQKF